MILKTLALSWLLANLEPLQFFLNKIIKPLIPQWLSYIKTALSCFKCISFWLTLCMTQDIYLASGAALIAFVFDKLMNAIPMRY